MAWKGFSCEWASIRNTASGMRPLILIPVDSSTCPSRNRPVQRFTLDSPAHTPKCSRSLPGSARKLAAT